LRAIFPFAVALATGCAARSGAPTAETPEATSPSSSDRDGSHFFTEHCRAKTRRDGRATLVTCNDQEVMLILPGVGWSERAATQPRDLLVAERGYWNITITAADPSESAFEASEHLEAIYRGIAGALVQRRLKTSGAHFERMKNGHLVLSYELSGSLDGMPVRQKNAWSALRRVGGQYLDYHVSWTENGGEADGDVKNVADSFFVTDGKGNAPAE
jgi:hypothetical protein